MKLFHGLRGLSLRSKFIALNVVVAGSLVMLAAQAWLASTVQESAQRHQVGLSSALSHSKQADMLHDALRSSVLASLLVGEVSGAQHGDIQRQMALDVRGMQEAFEHLAQLDLGAELTARVRENAVLAERYGQSAYAVVQLAAQRRAAALVALPQFEQRFEQLLKALDEQGKQIAVALSAAQAKAAGEAATARQSFLWACVITIAMASALVAAVTVMVRRRLLQLGDVARAIAAGELERRVGSASDDEIGQVGHAIDRMAGSLHQMIETMKGDAKRASFGKNLAEALDMADREAQVCAVAARAMVEVSPHHGMELLVSDSSRAQMERAASHPLAGAPGCGVASPYDCVAVRRGNVVGFESSEALNACEHLRDRGCGATSAVCVPVTFMGRAIGVLHAAGPVDKPLSVEQAQQLGTLGVQVGMRVGTVRAFEKTQIQAATDSLTGLPNRRTLEQKMRNLATGDGAFAVVMCDLDRFKLLNDTHGHAAGDNALRLFAEALRHSLRGADVAGRWGGEEFAFVLVGADAKAALAMVERLRKRLASSLQGGKVPPFTASFGIADSGMSRSPELLIQMADVALYQAKANGRDRACVATGEEAAVSRDAEDLGLGIDQRALAEATA